MKGVFRGAAASAVALFIFALPAAGADTAAGEKRAGVCAACHGAGGNSTDPAAPTIAGQPAQFIAMSLYMFREGNRKNAEMTPMATGLSHTEMNDLAAYFAAQNPQPSKHRARPENAEAGPGLARKFSCTQCHGLRLLGQQHIPRLAGQQFEYLRAQLRAFKTGARQDLDGKMSESIQPLSDKEIDVLADYIAGLGI